MRAIDVIYIKQEHPLGTEDGVNWCIYPALPDDDEADAGRGK